MSKQVILIRTDLAMSAGKAVSQGAHASVAVVLDIMRKVDTDEFDYEADTIDAIESWLNGTFTKIALRVNSEDELLDIYDKARFMKIPCSLITDSGKTEFDGVPTNTAVALGPDVASKIDKLTSHLKLL